MASRGTSDSIDGVFGAISGLKLCDDARVSFSVMSLVLLAALLHAVWNAFIKSGQNKFTETVLLVTGAGMIAGVALLFLPIPDAASWPYLAASVAIHFVYFSLVAGAYRAGDLSVVYPVMRGSAPVFTALLSVGIVGEQIGNGGWLGVGLLCAGILWLAQDGWRTAQQQRKSLVFGLLNAAVIVAYTLVDGVGARTALNSWSYVLWMFFLNMLVFFGVAAVRHRPAIRAIAAKGWLKGAAAGLCSIGSYGLALWAMTHAPIALVAALRETSALFGTALAAIVLKERFGRTRWLAAALITAGAIAMKLS